MRENPKNLSQYTRVIEHRVVRPAVWNAIVRKRIEGLDDDAFLHLLDFRGSLEAFIRRFHSEARLRFFFHPRNQKDFFLQLLTSTQPHEEILAEAQDVLEDKFETLGSGKVSLALPGSSGGINWHRDFKSGKVWPARRLSREEILDPGNPSDIKVPWELSRFHQVWWLGKAYWLTRNERYAQKFGELVDDWIAKNPIGLGPNWTHAMEAAIRACNWIAGYYFFCESASLSPAFWLRFIKSLYAHGRFIENNREYSWRNGNHFLSNVVGLVFLGNFFHHEKFGKRWLDDGISSLEEEMEEEVYEDGVSYEKSTSYHRLVVELFSSATVLCSKNNIRFSKRYMQRLEKMFEFVQQYTRPDGSTPLVGDADDGRLFRFSMSEDINDHRHALAVGSILFQRSDFKVAAGRFSQDALWLFGGEGFERYQLLRGEAELPASRVFAAGGFYILRSKEVHVFVDAGDLGMLGRGGHGHNDTLSFELWANGEALLVDSGTFAYTFDFEARQAFRGTKAHNTIAIDGQEQAAFAGLWSVKKDETHPIVTEWKTSPTKDVLEAAHYGYRTLPSPVVHRRRFEFEKQVQKIKITDHLAGTGTHAVESLLHFAPKVNLRLIDDQTAVAKNSTGRYDISADRGVFSILETRFSRSYGVQEPNCTLRLTLDAQLPQTITIDIQYERALSK